jgi:hypothetical protein
VTSTDDNDEDEDKEEELGLLCSSLSAAFWYQLKEKLHGESGFRFRFLLLLLWAAAATTVLLLLLLLLLFLVVVSLSSLAFTSSTAVAVEHGSGSSWSFGAIATTITGVVYFRTAFPCGKTIEPSNMCNSGSTTSGRVLPVIPSPPCSPLEVHKIRSCTARTSAAR